MKNPWEDGKKEVESLFKERMAKITKSGEGNRYLDPQTEKKKKKKRWTPNDWHKVKC